MSRQQGRAAFSRRTILRQLGWTTAALGLAPLVSCKAEVAGDGSTSLPIADDPKPNLRELARFVDALPQPPIVSSGALAAAGLVLASGEHLFHRDFLPTPTFGYAGAPYLGPTIEAQSGVAVSFLAANDLGPHPLRIDTRLHGALASDRTEPRAAVHLHGGYVAEEHDGSPEQTIATGATRRFVYPYDQQSGSTWYHDHSLGITRLNVYAGLAGFHPIRDAYDPGVAGGPLGAAGVPLARGGRELLVALQDKTFLHSRRGGHTELHYPYPWEPEFFGDLPVINGKVFPYVALDAAVVRMRLINGSSSRFYNLEFDSPLVAIWQIGTDTGLLAAPVRISSQTPLVLAPGERADVLVDLRAVPGQVVHLVDVALPTPVTSPGPGPFGAILQVRVGSTVDQAGIPTVLRPVTRLIAGDVVRERTVALVEIARGSKPVAALINNQFFHAPESAWEHPVAGTLERWNIVNATEDTHPIHLHLVQFQVENRQPFDADEYLLRVFGTQSLGVSAAGRGPHPIPAVLPSEYDGSPRPPPANELGWKDTVQAHPGEITRILVPFGAAAAAGVPFGMRNTFTGAYVFHCHILDHEDNEMMQRYRVVAG